MMMIAPMSSPMIIVHNNH